MTLQWSFTSILITQLKPAFFFAPQACKEAHHDTKLEIASVSSICNFELELQKKTKE